MGMKQGTFHSARLRLRSGDDIVDSTGEEPDGRTDQDHIGP